MTTEPFHPEKQDGPLRFWSRFERVSEALC